MVMLKVMIDK